MQRPQVQSSARKLQHTRCAATCRSFTRVQLPYDKKHVRQMRSAFGNMHTLTMMQPLHPSVGAGQVWVAVAPQPVHQALRRTRLRHSAIKHMMSVLRCLACCGDWRLA